MRKQVTIGKEWQRCEFTFTPTQPFLFIAIGLDLEASRREAAALWLDSVQLERGDHATAYEPRQPLEAFLETGPAGSISTNLATGLTFSFQAFNNADQPQTLRWMLQVTDFFDHLVVAKEHVLSIRAHDGGSLALRGLCKGQQGFFRATWEPSVPSAPTSQQTEPGSTLRCALITPAAADLSDSPLGFNHAYPWDFLVQSAREAGIVWWRDWSAKWQTVEPAEGQI